ncbi:multidrug ABC transporter ATP-binding protein [Rhizobium dioscoreae]|uniref:Multidrug ABC transporter ATP-binding protein n=1 Tax=Rhizobium dioscoreae TaxID=2653122 RepID=A0ABQ0YY62_9HYPH|nr:MULTISPECIES: ABC transporter ATP-binding protein [Rhizobium]MCZ3377602.1 ABC transporter ATP-binding protein [Rhizobium sp. AG207R]GES45675.1 multidrug ABC transporter ATP-binding protein [Rhizobium dioscoreae]GES48038.1 multidrug ABC transporter ATP-binding protein [Rhizobium dioscoreae]GLU79494.1 multidrug ABC transporter ATP-binding protein [Rhizobium sp. NBRC 114257]
MFRRFEELVDPFQDHDELQPSPKAWRYLLTNLRPFRTVMAISLSLTVIGAIIEIWLIGYSSRLVDDLAAARREDFWASEGFGLLAAAALVLIGRPLAGYLRESLDDIAFRPNAETLFRWRAHRHVLRQSVGWFRQDFSGRIASQVRDIGTAATGAAYQVLHTLSFVTIYVAGSLWLMASIDPRLIWPLAVWLFCYLALMAYVIPRLQKASAQYQGAYAELTGMLVDSYANIDLIKLFADARAEDKETRRRFSQARETFVRVQRLEVLVNSSMLFLGSFLIVTLVGYAVVLWQSGGAPLGLIAASLALSFRITGMAEWMLDAVSSLFAHLGAMRQSLLTVSQPLAITDMPCAKPLAVTNGEIAFREVTHRYGKEDGGLDGISLRIEAGQKVGLVGRSGTGKSTLVNLLLRFFDPEAGIIEIDGQDIRQVTQDSLRRQIAVVGQEASLLHRSIRDNIAHGNLSFSEDAVLAAAEKAAASDFIAGLRDQEGRIGFDAHAGERGVQLSGGQRQRVAIARAILKDAPILVLDEATSALDSEVEAEIQDTLYGIMEDKTVIAIAHRLSTIARMDRIVVLDHGRIVEDGTHAELIARNGIYATLWSHQSGGFIEGDEPPAD